jgi:hypothetical protein
MSAPSNISRTDIARYFIFLQPPLVADRLFNNTSFRTEFGLPSRDAISFGGGPAMLKATLYDGVRTMFAEQRPQSVVGITGDAITVSHSPDHVALSFPADGGGTTTVHVLNLMLLSPTADIRLGALQRIVNEIGPTGPDLDYWHKKVQQEALDDGRMDEFLRQIDASIVPNMARVARDTMAGVVDKTHIVPRELDYWEALCGPPPGSVEQETWLNKIFEPHRRRLIQRDLVQGLRLCLAMGIHDDLTPRALVTDVSHDELWAALEQLKPFDDPFSLVGIVDLAAGRSHEDDRFATLASESMARLCSTQLSRADGLDIYGFFPAVLDLLQAELRVMPSTAACPAYWRRICAWTQTALLLRAFQTIRLDSEQFSEGVKTLLPSEAQTAELLDLRQSPLSHPAETSRDLIRAEVLGRLVIVQQRQAKEGQDLPGSDVLVEALARQAKDGPLLTQMPGPLELDRLPAIQLETLSEEFEEFKADLRRRVDELTSEIDDQNWLVFLHLSRLFVFGDHILERITKLVPSTKLGANGDDRRSALNHMGRLSYIALAQRNISLADAILTRCVQAIGPWTDEQLASALVHIGYIATAASGQEDVTKDRFVKYLRNLAFLLPQGAPCRALCAELEVLKTFTPISEWHSYAEAEALCLLGC